MSITFSPTPTDVARDRYGRPLITPPDGGKPIPYTRVSTLAKALDNKEGLMKWKQRQVAIGLAARPDLVGMAQAVRDDKRKLDEIVDIAMTAAESERAANVGTALHSLSERVDDGDDISAMPDQFIDDLRAYRVAMSGLEVVAKELFIVADEVQAAGTFDRLLRLPDGRIVVADLKTGQDEPKYPMGVTQQVAIYSRGHLYDPEQGRVGHLPSLGIDQQVGLMIHLPAGQGTCTLYELDLTVGWQLACVSVGVRQAFKTKALPRYEP